MPPNNQNNSRPRQSSSTRTTNLLQRTIGTLYQDTSQPLPQGRNRTVLQSVTSTESSFLYPSARNVNSIATFPRQASYMQVSHGVLPDSPHSLLLPQGQSGSTVQNLQGLSSSATSYETFLSDGSNGRVNSSGNMVGCVVGTTGSRQIQDDMTLTTATTTGSKSLIVDEVSNRLQSYGLSSVFSHSDARDKSDDLFEQAPASSWKVRLNHVCAIGITEKESELSVSLVDANGFEVFAGSADRNNPSQLDELRQDVLRVLRHIPILITYTLNDEYLNDLQLKRPRRLCRALVEHYLQDTNKGTTPSMGVVVHNILNVRVTAKKLNSSFEVAKLVMKLYVNDSEGVENKYLQE